MSKRIFITGGASGLGRALAERYADVGARVCFGDVDEATGLETLNKLQDSGATAHFIKCDVRVKEDFDAAANWMKENWGGVDLIINNAGVAHMGSIETSSIEDWQWIIDINILGIVKSCQSFIPLLKEQRQGRIVNVASMAGLLHLPNASAYNATKAAVVAISETLLIELENSGIDVSVVCPAFFRTDLAKNMRASNAEAERVTKRLVERSRIGANEIAEIIIDGISSGKFHIFTHPHARKAWYIKRFLPFKTFLNGIRKETRKLDERMARPERKDL